MINLKDKLTLVTGASRGIGHTIAHEFAKQGAKVVGTATTSQGAEKITAGFNDAGLSGIGLVLDVTNTDSINAMLADMKQQLGMPEILINNAGITRDNIMMRMKPEEWEQVIDTNLNAIFRLSKACLRDMIKARWGRIINISSIVGCIGNAGQANYAAAKAGIIGFSKSLAKEVASRNVTVNVVAPGFFDTDMTSVLSEAQREALLAQIPAGCLGETQDIAASVAFLASDAAKYITGQTLHVNGGMFMN